MKKKIKIATVYISRRIEKFEAVTMDTIRWLRISEGLAKLGYQVDIITNEKDQSIVNMACNLRRVPYSNVDWQSYDIVKTLFHEGFQSLEKAGGSNHPFIIAKVPTIGREEQDRSLKQWSRWRLLWIQKRINQKARYIAVLNQGNKDLWEKEYGKKNNILIVPTGVDLKIPKPKNNPYKKIGKKIVLYAGHLSGRDHRKLNIYWQNRLNNLGQILKTKDIHLCFVGPGLNDKLRPEWVASFGPVSIEKFWDYQYWASCGIVLAGARKIHSEQSKIYYYLRTGLPVVSETPITNNFLIKETNLGYISSFNNNVQMAALIEKAIYHKWNKRKAIDYIVKNHTWDKRVEIYDKLIRKHFKVN